MHRGFQLPHRHFLLPQRTETMIADQQAGVVAVAAAASVPLALHPSFFSLLLSSAPLLPLSLALQLQEVVVQLLDVHV